VLRRYARAKPALNARGVFVGRARLALNAAACIRCGLCLTGCPHSLIYSAAQTMDQMRRHDLEYHGGLLATRIEETPDGVVVTAKDIETGQLHRFQADRVFVACGAIGTSRIVLGSLDLYGAIPVLESAQFILPFASRRAVADPRGRPDFTLNQFNIVVTLDDECLDASQLHMYTYNSAFLEALPGLLSQPLLSPARTAALRRLSIAFGYLPSWESPGFTIQAHPAAAPGTLPALRVTGRAGRQSAAANAMLRSVLARLSRSARALDLWPLLPALKMSAPGKSYHWGGTFAHARKAGGPLNSDVLGRVAPWTRVHLVDASVFPTIPATTFTLTVMANAHRIAQTALRELA
jgi:ferredoxin